MARYEQLAFVELSFKFFISKNYHQGIKVIEIGSYDVNGSVRKNFPSCHYTGIDLINGPGVDIVSSGESVDLPDDTYDVAISCECFEHNQSWRGTFINMHRMTKPGGLMIITCASRGRTEHGTERTTPSDSPGTQFAGNAYYRNLNVRDFKTSFNLAGMFRHYQFFYNGISKDLYFCGWKKAGASLFEGNYD
jgi:Methyltransferase domain.